MRTASVNAASALGALLVLLSGVAGSLDAQSRTMGQVPDIVVTFVARSFTKDALGSTFAILVEVPPNHHGYLDRGDDGFLIPFAFSFPTLEKAGATVELVSKPKGERDDDFRAHVLRGRGEFRFRLAPTFALASQTWANLRYQICNDRTSICYPPKVVQMPIRNR